MLRIMSRSKATKPGIDPSVLLKDTSWANIVASAITACEVGAAVIASPACGCKVRCMRWHTALSVRFYVEIGCLSSWLRVFISWKWYYPVNSLPFIIRLGHRMARKPCSHGELCGAHDALIFNPHKLSPFENKLMLMRAKLKHCCFNHWFHTDRWDWLQSLVMIVRVVWPCIRSINFMHCMCRIVALLILL